jgi:hypothetical protein
LFSLLKPTDWRPVAKRILDEFPHEDLTGLTHPAMAATAEFMGRLESSLLLHSNALTVTEATLDVVELWRKLELTGLNLLDPAGADSATRPVLLARRGPREKLTGAASDGLKNTALAESNLDSANLNLVIEQ